MSLEACILAAKSAGSPEDQVRALLTRGYVPFPWQWRFHAASRLCDNAEGPVKIGAGGARGPGKSHAVFAQVTLDDCQRIPGLKALFLRQTGKAAKESFEDLITKVLAGKVAYHYNRSNNVLTFPNNSRVILGGFHDERDVDQYIGIEYDLIAIEELNQLVEDKIEKLLGSMRTSKKRWRPRLYASFNPGGVGHEFVKNLFIAPQRSGQENKTRFIPSTYKENPFLNLEYIEYLEGLTGDLGKAWRDGEWDLFAGQYFDEWRREKHVIPAFQVPVSWMRFRAYDHGRDKPACCLWFAVDFDGRAYCYRELYVRGWNIDQISQEINRLSSNETYSFSVADPSIFAKTGFVDRYGGQTIAETFAHHGIAFSPASNRRIDGWNIMHEYLHWEDNKPPKLLFFNTCHNIIRTLPMLIHDDKRTEDLNTRGEDHSADACRYFLASLHMSKTAPARSFEQKEFERKFGQKNYITGDIYNRESMI